MHFDPATDEHRLLARFAGDWTLVGEGGTGTEHGTMLGERWLSLAGQAKWEGGEHEYLFLIGYDRSLGRYVGSFAASVMDKHWVYEGWFEGEALILETTGPGPDPQAGDVRLRDRIERIGERKVLTSTALTPDGEWVEFMRVEHERPRAEGA